VSGEDDQLTSGSSGAARTAATLRARGVQNMPLDLQNVAAALRPGAGFGTFVNAPGWGCTSWPIA
jgi:hypothetical protein